LGAKPEAAEVKRKLPLSAASSDSTLISRSAARDPEQPFQVDAPVHRLGPLPAGLANQAQNIVPVMFLMR